MKFALGLIAAGLIGTVAYDQAQEIVKPSEEQSAYTQGRAVSHAAFLLWLSDGELEWSDALQITVAESKDNEGQLTVTGTTVRWTGGGCWDIPLPDPESLVVPQPCEVGY